MRVLVDYRPALRARTGVGEWVHNLTRTWLSLPVRSGDPSPMAIGVFVSSWKDRLTPESRADLHGATCFDRRIPVRVLTWAWNRLGWPPAELLTKWPADVAFSPTPLLLPSRAPVRVVTVHDLDFLDHPDRTWGEMRRDFPALVARHVRTADLVMTISQFTAREAARRLDIPDERMVVCRPGVPDWISSRTHAPSPPGGPNVYILFVGTLEPRKNVAGLLEAYTRLVARKPDAPRLVLAGGRPPVMEPTLEAALTGPIASRVDARGYLRPEDRLATYAHAAMLVLPSNMEGFGLPVLEAMALGVPVIVSSRGALPEVAGNAGLIVEPGDADGLAHAMGRILDEPGLASAMREQGYVQAASFDWRQSAQAAADRFRSAVETARHAGTTRPRRD